MEVIHCIALSYRYLSEVSEKSQVMVHVWYVMCDYTVKKNGIISLTATILDVRAELYTL